MSNNCTLPVRAGIEKEELLANDIMITMTIDIILCKYAHNYTPNTQV